MTNTILLIIVGFSVIFNLILTLIVWKMKNKTSLAVSITDYNLIEVAGIHQHMIDEREEAIYRFKKMRESYLKALVTEIKRYKQTTKEKTRKLSYRTKK
jgi:hypothetical protein